TRRLGPVGLASDRVPVDPFPNRFVSDPRFLRNPYATVLHSHFRVDDVLLPVPGGSGSISGQCKPREGSDRNIVGPSDTGLQHPSAPDGNTAVGAQVVDSAGLGQAADPPDLDIDDFTAS